MKITNIVKETSSIFQVTLKPNWLERFFGIKEETKRFKDSGNEYMFGSETIYLNEKGIKIGRGYIQEELDEFRRKF